MNTQIIDTRRDNVAANAVCLPALPKKRLPTHLSTIHRLVKPYVLFLNHSITHEVEGWEKTSSSEFINRYVFPAGQLDTVSNIQRGMERARFEIADVKALRRDDALTLRHWIARLERNHDEPLRYVIEFAYRVRRLYTAACALEFKSDEIGVYQMLASKRAVAAARLPLTRAHLHRASRVTTPSQRQARVARIAEFRRYAAPSA